MSEQATQSAQEDLCEICDVPLTLANLGVFPKLCIGCSKDMVKALKEIERGEVVEYEV
jgi:hypothetical protein